MTVCKRLLSFYKYNQFIFIYLQLHHINRELKQQQLVKTMSMQHGCLAHITMQTKDLLALEDTSNIVRKVFSTHDGAKRAFKQSGDDSWYQVLPVGDNVTATIPGLVPGREYEIVAVSIAEFNDETQQETQSAPIYVRTPGNS
jgi:hypothetical protein